MTSAVWSMNSNWRTSSEASGRGPPCGPAAPGPPPPPGSCSALSPGASSPSAAFFPESLSLGSSASAALRRLRFRGGSDRTTIPSTSSSSAFSSALGTGTAFRARYCHSSAPSSDRAARTSSGTPQRTRLAMGDPSGQASSDRTPVRAVNAVRSRPRAARTAACIAASAAALQNATCITLPCSMTTSERSCSLAAACSSSVLSTHRGAPSRNSAPNAAPSASSPRPTSGAPPMATTVTPGRSASSCPGRSPTDSTA
mmetsp:Transcript_47414/g.133826  ORF Transcript_47414/g.133826 Transcript_47414/m.133826 type:complete len:256 (+) Transcript_47414:602-1369(+)